MTTWNRNEPTSAARTAVLVISSLTDGSFAPAATDFSSAIKIRLGGTSWTAAGGTLTNTGYDGHWVYVALQSETNLTANEVELRIDDPTYYAQTLIQLSDLAAVKAKTDHLPSVNAGAVGGLPIITAIGQGPGGQLKPNSFIDNYIYDVNKSPTSWRVRIFATKTACDAAVAGHADDADNEVERYNFTATYNPVDKTLTTYKIDKSL